MYQQHVLSNTFLSPNWHKRLSHQFFQKSFKLEVRSILILLTIMALVVGKIQQFAGDFKSRNIFYDKNFHRVIWM